MKVCDHGEYLQIIPETDFEKGIFQYNFHIGKNYIEGTIIKSSLGSEVVEEYWLELKKHGISPKKLKEVK